MNNEVKFNHNADGIFGALGIKYSHEELSDKMASICMNFVMSNGDNVSKLAEKIQKELPANVILLLALQGVLDTMKGAIDIADNCHSDSSDSISDMMHMLASGRSIKKII
jgi:hypothetical protein